VTTDPSNAPPTSDSASHAVYAMGSTDRERRRLMRQGELLRELLADAFRAAGIRPGMRVLDIGSGAGDVAMLAAEMVGPTGSVVGLDRDSASVAWAAKRVAEAGIANIHFQTAQFNEFTDSRPFDALVGRFILLYLPDPTATLRHLAQSLRSGAAIAFFEPDFTVPSRTFPEMPEFERYGGWIAEALRRSGARTDMGMRLYSTYRDAGFVGTETAVSHLSGCGITLEMAEYLTETVRSVLPKLEQFGIATREQIQIDTLTDRVMAAGRAADPQWVSTRYIAAWAKKP
jgi:ubiquinone/menaquinone biosynthesis C-methylase UbiE